MVLRFFIPAAAGHVLVAQLAERTEVKIML